MAKVNLVNKQVVMELTDIIRYQLITHCFVNRIILSELDLDCLTLLGVAGETELTEFCNLMAERRLKQKIDSGKGSSKKQEASPQTIRNILIKVEKESLLVKNGKGRKKIKLNPDLKIQTGGNILLNYKIVHIGSEES